MWRKRSRSVSKTNMSCSTRDASIGDVMVTSEGDVMVTSEDLPAGRNRLCGKVALVIGGGSIGPGWGNGKAVSVLYARDGAKVFVVDARKEAADETVDIIRSAGGDATS